MVDGAQTAARRRTRTGPSTKRVPRFGAAQAECSVARTAVRNAIHSRRETASLGPSGSLLSRTITRSGSVATSTHPPPLPPEYDDLRQAIVTASISLPLSRSGLEIARAATPQPQWLPNAVAIAILTQSH